MNFLPVLIVGGAFIALSGKKKRRRIVSKSKALPAANVRGEIFSGENPPDLIVSSVGERFSVSLSESPGTGHVWELSASPPDNSIALASTEVDVVGGNGMTSQQNRVFVFEGQKQGEGSLVFHLVRPWMKGKEHPVEIVEIQTRIS